MRDERLLRAAALLYAAGLALHTADHLRRGLDAVTLHVLWAGNLSTVVGVVAVVLVLTRHRLGPAAAVAAGFPIAIGVRRPPAADVERLQRLLRRRPSELDVLDRR